MEGHDLERPRTDAATAENLNHLARLLSNGSPVNLKLNGRRVTLPADASLSIDLERDPETGCAEVDIRWSTGSLSSRRRSADAPGGNASVRERGDRAAELKTRSNQREVRAPGPHIRLKAIIAAPRI